MGRWVAHVVDVMVCDEAHRLRLPSRSRFTPRKTDNLPQIQELLNAAKCCVFLLDDNQVVRPGEISSFDYIRKQAHEKGCRVFDYELEAQFRCAGLGHSENRSSQRLGKKLAT